MRAPSWLQYWEASYPSHAWPAYQFRFPCGAPMLFTPFPSDTTWLIQSSTRYVAENDRIQLVPFYDMVGRGLVVCWSCQTLLHTTARAVSKLVGCTCFPPSLG